MTVQEYSDVALGFPWLPHEKNKTTREEKQTNDQGKIKARCKDHGLSCDNINQHQTHC